MFLLLIFTTKNPTELAKNPRGIFVNLGGRFVTLGLSFQVSHWAMETKKDDVSLKRDMSVVTTGGYKDPFVWNIEYAYIRQEFAPGQQLYKQSRTWRNLCYFQL